jgi:FixJ family two-component response regulator
MVRTDYLHKAQSYISAAARTAQYTIETTNSTAEKSKATKAVSKYTNQLSEIQLYDQAIAHIANKRLALDLDDGVKTNYAKFQGIEVAREGMKTVKIDLLGQIK